MKVNASEASCTSLVTRYSAYASTTTTVPLPFVDWSSATVTNEYISSCKTNNKGNAKGGCHKDVRA